MFVYSIYICIHWYMFRDMCAHIHIHTYAIRGDMGLLLGVCTVIRLLHDSRPGTWLYTVSVYESGNCSGPLSADRRLNWRSVRCMVFSRTSRQDLDSTLPRDSNVAPFCVVMVCLVGTRIRPSCIAQKRTTVESPGTEHLQGLGSH